MPRLKTSRHDSGSARRLWTRIVLALLVAELCHAIDASPTSASGRSTRTPLSRCPAIFGQSTPASEAASPPKPCRHFLNARVGTLTTPNFPAAFPVPFVCSWIINATGFEPESYIALYLTQMYLTRGVQAVQYAFRNETHALGRRELDELHTLRPRPYSVYRIKARYLEVLVNLDEVVNANLRVEHRLMDVYGFNITYEIQPSASRMRNDTCNAVNCTFNGHCYANRDYSQFQCSCLPGFSGKYCEFGPDCNPELGVNICKNGGKCSYRTGLTVVRCSCPLNYNGSLCEFRRESIPAKECVARFGLNCSHQCSLSDAGSVECRCPNDYALKSDKLTCYPLVPFRALGYVEFDRPATWNDSVFVQGFTDWLRLSVNGFTAGKLTVGSVQLLSPGSGRLQFVLWNSEKYNTSWPAARPVSSMRLRNVRGVRDVRGSPIIPALHLPQQWNASFASFSGHIDRFWRKHWEIYEEHVPVKSLTMLAVPALHIEWIRVDAKGGRVREGHPFIVACNANGTEKVKLRWFKDGFPIDPSYALLRNVSLFVHQERNLRGFYTLYLEVKQAVLADRGHYECQASDWGQTTRQSVFLDVITSPVLDLMPNNPSVSPGSLVNLTCRDENHLARRTMTKYEWLRNGQLIRSSCDEIIEDLTPVGSLLRISSIKKNANYTCRAENGTTISEVTTHITVVHPEEACPQQQFMNVNWPMTAVSSAAYRFCPNGYVGVAKRRCSSPAASFADPGTIGANNKPNWQWDRPIFSHCSERFVADLHRKLKLVSLGYRVMEIDVIVTNFTNYIWDKLNRTLSSSNDEETAVFLPGEGNTILDLARSLESFLWKGSHLMGPLFWNTAAVDYFYALDALLSMPISFFYPENVTPVMRLMQSHMALLGLNPRVENSRSGNPLDSIKSNQLKNSAIDIHDNKRELKYKGTLPAFQSETELKTVQQLAPALFVYVTNTTNFTFAFSVKEKVVPAKDGMYICALLRLQPTNHSRNWDVDSCSVKQLFKSATYECQCPQAGTALLLYATKEAPEVSPDLWVLIWFAAASSLLVLIICLGTLTTRWYRHRTLWGWFKMQLGIALFPISMSHFLPPRVIISDVYWAFSLTTCLYMYLTTTLVISVHGKMIVSSSYEETVEYNIHRNRRLIGLTCGVPLILSVIHCLLSELAFRSSFTSWLAELGSISGILFCLLYITLLLMNAAMCIFFREKRGPLEKNEAQDSNNRAQDANEMTRVHRNYCACLLGLSLLFAGSVLLEFNLETTGAHCSATSIHAISMLVWAFIVLTLDGNESILCFRWRVRLVEAHTVSEMMNATALVESPLRTNPLETPDSSKISKNRRICDSIVSGLNDLRRQRRRTCRHNQASSPLLRRAGLGPEVLRAFGIEHTEKLLSESETRPANSANGFNNASSRRRVHSGSSDEMQHDDLDSGFGPSGGGGSQKFINVERISEVFKVFRHFSWRFSFFGRSLTLSSNGGSFRSRKSTMSSATTTELPAEQGSISGIEEMESHESFHAFQENVQPHFPVWRARTRWKDDYGRKLELNSSEANDTSITSKPFRGRCFIRCSPEKTGKRPIQSYPQSGAEYKKCERCWNNPETPPCQCCSPQSWGSGTVYMQAIIEAPPRRLENSGEYLEMDPAGSLAIDPQRIKPIQAYYNLRSLRSSPVHSMPSSVKSGSDRTYSSTPSLLSHRDKKIISGRIAKRYRNTVRSATRTIHCRAQPSAPREHRASNVH